MTRSNVGGTTSLQGSASLSVEVRIPLSLVHLSLRQADTSSSPKKNRLSLIGWNPAHTNKQCASKHAILGLSRSLAKEYAAEKVRVNVVAPGPIETPYLQSVLDSLGGGEGTSLLEAVPMRRYGQPEEVARAIAFLLSKEASYITVSSRDSSSPSLSFPHHCNRRSWLSRRLFHLQSELASI